MPLVVSDPDGREIWPPEPARNGSCSRHSLGVRTESLEVGLINNMPDLALEDTESQFFRLLDEAAGEAPVRARLFSLPNLPRGEEARKRLGRIYCGITELWNTPLDAIIITGTEPRQFDLKQEPYWPALVDVLDWAEEETASTALSCLAAHAAVLHSDGICRTPLAEKRVGIFEVETRQNHPLTGDLKGGRLHFPHSRWNEIGADRLRAAGYLVLTQSSVAGVDLFAKQKRSSLFVGFQGHPEYGRLTLLREYRRDIRRFLRGERAAYPALPFGYFCEEARGHLECFRERALENRSEDLMTDFPQSAAARELEEGWHRVGVEIYRNWLRYVAARKREKVFAARFQGAMAAPVAGRMTPEVA